MPTQQLIDRIKDGIVASLALTAYINAITNKMSSDEIWKLWEMIDNAVVHFKAILEVIPAGQARAAAMHSLIDMEASQASIGKASCKRGCFGCCRQTVKIFADEMALLGQPPELGISGFCVFLNQQGECSVYLDRPAMCRLHEVTSSPDLCSRDTGSINRIVKIIPELVLSAYAELEPSQEKVTIDIRP